jgi:antitoxin ParD1/3/4
VWQKINTKGLKTMSISLKPEHEQFIQSQIETGQYNSSDEVINEAFKLLTERENRLQELRQKIAIGTEQIARGQVTEGEAVFARLQKKIDSMAESEI